MVETCLRLIDARQQEDKRLFNGTLECCGLYFILKPMRDDKVLTVRYNCADIRGSCGAEVRAV